MKGEMGEVEAQKVLQGLACEIHNMSEEEKMLSLESIVLAELEGDINPFWAKVAKKMLVCEKTTNKLLYGKDLFLADSILDLAVTGTDAACLANPITENGELA